MNRRAIADAVISWMAPFLLLALTVSLVLVQLRTPSAIFGLWAQWAEVGIVALGMTAILLTGGVDLSVGSIVALASVTLGLAYRNFGFPIAAACGAAVAAGLLAGAANGALVVVGVPPLVATLATMAFFAGLAMAASGGERIADLPDAFTDWGNSRLLGLPVQAHAFLLIGIAVWIFVHGTRWGRFLFAIGDNRRAARLAAVPVARVEWSLYALIGLLAGITAVFYTARGGAATPDPSPDFALQVISCVILGGTRVTGGRGGVGRTMLGVAVLAHLEIGLRLLSSRQFPSPWGGSPWRFTADARLIVVGFAVIAVTVWNERIAVRREE